ncbi:hypothetical protein [Kribbella albertanoniae]|uniref:Uncharacterized protein n=1 Tax=Kribbella albertanoniae TaxID=1266829 RepID=A0A4R4Q446_9ACTN|nr:hypothetical protein [Kribbella albertanoniae]TDC29881.1 hypothetical protein E1261_14710 [Kribbella albertanoniae]
MNLDQFDLGEFMQDVGRAGFTMMLKIDHERLRDRSKPWTVLLSAPHPGGTVVMRGDLRTLEECLRAVISHMESVLEDREWLELYR